MRTVLTHPADRGAPPARQRRCWPLAVTGLALMAASVVMMAVGAQPSRAQTVRPHLAPARLAPLRLAPLRLPALTGRYFWAHDRGWRLDLTLNGSNENSYKDGVALIPQIARELGLTRGFVTRDIGTVHPARAVAAEDAYIAAFFDKFLRHGGGFLWHGGGHLLDGPSPRYPDVTFVR